MDPAGSGAKIRRMTVQYRLYNLTKVTRQMPAVGNLDGVGGALRCSFRIGMPPIAGDDLHAGMGPEPRSKLRGGRFR